MQRGADYYGPGGGDRGARAPARGRPGVRYTPGPHDRRHQGARGSVHPPHVLLKTRVLPVGEYATELKYGTLPKWEIQRIYGVPLLPIAVPLEANESEENYERCFVEWLEKKSIDIEQLRLDSNTERTQRISFAKFKAKMFTEGIRIEPSVKKDQEEPERDAEEGEEEGEIKDEPVKTEIKENVGGSGGGTLRVDQEQVAIKLETCERVDKRPREEEGNEWVQIKREWSGNLKQRTSNEDPIHHVEEHTQGEEAFTLIKTERHSEDEKEEATAVSKDTRDTPEPKHAPAEECDPPASPCVSVETPQDPIEAKLVADYDRVNDKVILREKQLEDSVARLGTERSLDIGQILQLQAENDELRRQIEVVSSDRLAVLALLVVYLWRKERNELDSLLNESGDADVARVQHTVHRKCAELARETTRVVAAMAVSTTHLDEAIASEWYDHMAIEAAALSAGESALKAIRKQRKRDLVALIRFDQRLRVEIHALLASTK